MDNNGYLNLNGHLLKVFLAIYDTNSVSKAAIEVGLNQSTISYSLEKLRACLDDPLFIKSGRGITATERAIALAPGIRSQLAGLEELANKENYIPELETQPVTIATNVTEFLPQCEQLYKMLTNIAPNMPIRFLDLGARENISPYLESGFVDLIWAGRLSQCPPDVNTKMIMRDQRVCFYDPAVRGPVKSLDAYCESAHAIQDFGGNTPNAIDAFVEAQGRKRNIKLCAPGVEALAYLVKGTDLLMTMQLELKKSIFSHLSYCPTPIPFPDFVVDMHWHRRMEYSARSIWLRNCVSECVLLD